MQKNLLFTLIFSKLINNLEITKKSPLFPCYQNNNMCSEYQKTMKSY